MLSVNAVNGCGHPADASKESWPTGRGFLLQIKSECSDKHAMPERSIIHINVADFAVAVERTVDRRLRSRPLIVAPVGAARAAVYDMSEEAYRCGVRKGMPLSRALRRCPDAEALPPHPDRYERAMATLFRLARPYSPRVEMTDTCGHLFLDATGTGRLLGPAPDVAWRIRRAVRAEMGVNPVWAVAPNKLVAKVATRVVKPDGEYIVRAGDEAAFLAPLPVFLLPGLAADAVRCLGTFNLIRAGQVADLSMDQLSVIFTGTARRIYETVRGIDPSPVMSAGKEPPSVRGDHVFGDDTNHTAVVEAVLYALTETCGAELRRRRLCARRAGVVLDHSDGGRIIRQAVVRPAAFSDVRLFAAARAALERAWIRRVRIRRLALAFDRLTFPPAQLSLFCEDRRAARHEAQLTRTIDAVRARFGPEALKVGRTLAAMPP
jgi:DNA polymerase IV